MSTSTSKWVAYKLTSGRFLLTIMAGVGLLMMETSILQILREKAVETNSLSAGELLAFASTIFVVIQSVFMSYFSIRRENGNGNGGEHLDDADRPATPVQK